MPPSTQNVCSNSSFIVVYRPACPGFKKQVMVIYNGNHYDALAISKGPRASPEDDETEFNPRTKRGKMILAAAKKLVRPLGMTVLQVVVRCMSTCVH